MLTYARAPRLYHRKRLFAGYLQGRQCGTGSLSWAANTPAIPNVRARANRALSNMIVLSFMKGSSYRQGRQCGTGSTSWAANTPAIPNVSANANRALSNMIWILLYERLVLPAGQAVRNRVGFLGREHSGHPKRERQRQQSFEQHDLDVSLRES